MKDYLRLILETEGLEKTLRMFRLCYGDSHYQEEGETDLMWLERCAEQDFDDGMHRCIYPLHYRKAINLGICKP